VKKIDQARVDPIGAEITALKIVASRAEAVRTSPVLFRTNSRLVDPVVAMNPSWEAPPKENAAETQLDTPSER
jgi:hypothetical protein